MNDFFIVEKKLTFFKKTTVKKNIWGKANYKSPQIFVKIKNKQLIREISVISKNHKFCKYALPHGKFYNLSI